MFPIVLSGDRCPEEEGIKTGSHPARRRRDTLVTDALKKKGLRHSTRPGNSVAKKLVTDALKKKGLRPSRRSSRPSTHPGDRCPEEEGIKTQRPRQAARPEALVTDALKKKGLRPSA